MRTTILLLTALLGSLGQAQSGIAEVNNTRLYFERAGSGPAVVLLHGGNLDSRMWDDQVAPLSQSFTVVRHDIRPIRPVRAVREGVLQRGGSSRAA